MKTAPSIAASPEYFIAVRYSVLSAEGFLLRSPLFTVDDHLRVQMQIEEGAYELWRTRGCRQEGALDNWLQAEGEVLEEFIRGYRKAQH